MTKTRHAELSQMLEARCSELQRDLQAKLHDARAAHAGDGDMHGGRDAADASDADLQQEIGLALIEIKAEALRHVQAALARLASGEYGLCADCGEEISQPRLTALPFARRCRTCEEISEVTERRARQLTRHSLESSRLFDAAGGN
jgi:DnaK suppressor protein